MDHGACLQTYEAKDKMCGIDTHLKELPSSQFKSVRQLVVSALTDGRTDIHNFGISDDSEILIGVFKKLGWDINCSNQTISIDGNIEKMRPYDGQIDLVSSGLGYRIITMLASLGVGQYFVTGNERMKKRVIQPLEDAMRSLGIDITSNGGFPPVTVKGVNKTDEKRCFLKGGNIFMSGKDTSQFHTALLLIGAQNSEGLHIRSDNIVSEFYVEMTKQLIERAEIKIEISNDYKNFFIPPGQKFKKIKNVKIDTDLVMASYFLFLTVLVGGKIKIDIPSDNFENDIWILPLLRDHFNCKIETKHDCLELETHGAFEEFDVSANKVPFLLPTLAVMALRTDKKCRIRDVNSSNNKMTARKDSTVPAILRKLGAVVDITEKDLIITPPKKINNVTITVEDHKNDHRIIMALGILSQCEGVDIKIENPSAADKTFPDFFNIIESLKN